PKLTVYALAKLEGDLYIGTYNGLYRKREGMQAIEPVSLSTAHNRNNFFVNSLWVDAADGTVWVGAEGALYHYDPVSASTTEAKPLHNQSVKSLAMDHRGLLLAGTDAGIYVYDPAEQTAMTVVHDARNE